MESQSESLTSSQKTVSVKGFSLFRMRMRLEGRWQHYRARVREIAQDSDKSTRAWMMAAREFGYVNRDSEVQIAQDAYRRYFFGQARRWSREFSEVRMSEIEFEDFEKVVATLPDTCPSSREMDWIRAHPAMMRAARRDGESRIMLTVADILTPPHGPCPSKSAAASLQHWCNNCEEFFKMLMSEHKKKADGSSGDSGTNSAGAMDMGIDELAAMLKDI